VALSDVQVTMALDPALPGVRVEAAARTVGRTGVEMEALTAVSVALLTIYDMAKAVDKSMVLLDIALIEKRGGKSGDWRRS
jgi:cyclic pyranopterin phosphate synthase